METPYTFMTILCVIMSVLCIVTLIAMTATIYYAIKLRSMLKEELRFEIKDNEEEE